MFYKILTIMLFVIISGCSSLPEPVVVKNELHIPKILLPNPPKVIELKDYEIISLSIDSIGLICLNGENFKIVGNNDNKKDSYIKELEDQLNYLREVIRKQNEMSKNKESKNENIR